VAGETTELVYLGAAVAAYWVVPFFVAGPIGRRKGRPWLAWTALGWVGLLGLALRSPDPRVVEARRRRGLGSYHVLGPHHAPRHVPVAVSGPRSAGLRSALTTRTEGPRLVVSRSPSRG
jgi:hypothetical protein